MHQRASSLPLLILLYLAVPGTATGQEITATERAALVTAAAGSNRDLAAAGRQALLVDDRLVELLLALSDRFQIRYRIPRAADPADALRGLCRGCTPAALLTAGYLELDARLARLRAWLTGATPFDAAALQAAAQEAILLAAALKAYALLEAIGFRDGGVADSGTLRGPTGTIPNWPAAAALMGGTPDAIRDHFARMLDRRRQAEAAGLEYPNADLGWLVPCLLNCGS